ncbi:SAM-dependent methyltransferase [Aerosakkonemataceae cyanobacterium BLCC-F154]|uniref:SAM-dependent methyltransferase n=1 Tax=Floridaenema fluviatile BLCC-F154 TaxID=3153640 RepID=A0ABV4YAK9_9CYAN
MGLKLENVIPWGRSFAEYVKMFNLTTDELKLNILDCAGGPASFNAEMTKQGYNVISCDPVYYFSANEIRQRIQDTYSAVVNGVKANLDCYVWQEINSPEHLGEVRMTAMEKFLTDFNSGRKEGRYLPHGLPVLPFNNYQFDLALCSHFLFTYTEQLLEGFHLAAIREMCRVSKEVRIFPLLNISGEESPLLQLVIDKLAMQGYTLEVKQVLYEFQKGGNQMLKVSPPK